MSTLTSERIAAIRNKNATRPRDWPDRYLVDELLDAIEEQGQVIERLSADLSEIHQSNHELIASTGYLASALERILLSWHDSIDDAAACGGERCTQAVSALRGEAVRDGA